ncbi:hypothetical protein BH18ACT1_BH18ACT1_02800 [soil metagenome]
MVFRVLADVVVVVHLGFILFVALGSLALWRWPKLAWAHVPALVYAIAIVTVGFICPLTPLEKWLRRRGDGMAYEGGFVDRYVEDVVYPDEQTAALRALAAVAVVAGYVAVVVRARRGRAASRSI